MDAGARAVFPERLGRALHAAARLVRLPRRAAQRRGTGRAIRQRQLRLHRLRLVQAVSGGRARRLSVVCESGEFAEAEMKPRICADAVPRICADKIAANPRFQFYPRQSVVSFLYWISMPTLDDAQSALERHFGFSRFREGQADVIEAVLAGRDVIVVMPTGGGKSLCYQLPALLFPGVTLVVSPLIALMKDQVDALGARDIAATYINSSLSYDEQLARLRGMSRGQYRLVYVAPERFRNARFVESLN